MSRTALFIVAILAMLLGATAQLSSSSGMEIESSSSGDVLASSSTGELFSSTIIIDISSSSAPADLSSSSSAEMESSSGSEMLSSSEPIFGSSSSEPFDSSSGEGMSSSTGGSSVPPFVPADWRDIDFLSNGASIVVSWGNKSDDNLMADVGTENGFIINGVSGGTVRLAFGNTYNISIDELAAPFGFYIDIDPEGNKPAGNITQPIMAAGNYNFTVNGTEFGAANDDQNIFLYYASSNTPFAGGAVILGHQSAAALRASIMVMTISAFFALAFPKW